MPTSASPWSDVSDVPADPLGLVLAELQRFAVFLGDPVPGNAQVDGVRILDLADEGHLPRGVVGRRDGVDDRCVALLGTKRAEQPEGLVLLGGQRRQQAGAGRLGAEVARRDREPALVDDRVAQGQMVAEETPAPGVLESRAAEEREEVLITAAEVAGNDAEDRGLALAKDILHRHDLQGLGIAAFAQAGGQQTVHERALVAAQPPHGDALAIGLGDEVPVQATGIGHRELALAPLDAVHAIEQRPGGDEHPADGVGRLEEVRGGERIAGHVTPARRSCRRPGAGCRRRCSRPARCTGTRRRPRTPRAVRVGLPRWRRPAGVAPPRR